MKVNGNNPAIELNAYLKQIQQRQQQASESKTQGAAKPGAANDKVELSERARELQQAGQALKEMPDVRKDKVEQVKMDVEKGTYKVVGAQVATNMLRESFENDTILQKVNTRV